MSNMTEDTDTAACFIASEVAVGSNTPSDINRSNDEEDQINIHPSSPKARVRSTKWYKQKFQNYWLLHPDFKAWIARDPYNKFGAYCTFCNFKMKICSKSTLERHKTTSKHVKNALKRYDRSTSERANMPDLTTEVQDFITALNTEHNMMAIDQSLRRTAKSALLTTADDFLTFVNSSPSPYHVVAECRKRLVAAGFIELKERDRWTIEPLAKYFVTRNQSTLVSFAVGGQYKSGNGFSIVGAHTDSPCLKVKPNSKKLKSGYLSVGVECYGGGIWHTWFDRDLTVAGRVLVKSENQVTHRLVHIKKPIMRIPNIAIHLMRSHNDSFGPNKETQMVPILATIVQEQLEKDSSTPSEFSQVEFKHHPLLVKLLCDQLECRPDQIMDFELCLADTQAAVIGGALDEFILSPRLDNQVNCYGALEGLIASCKESSLEKDSHIRMALLFDNEEVGSQSAQGAGSSITEWIMRRLAGPGTSFEESIPKSLLISADQAHAVHPNYADKHEENHKAALHGGPVLKYNGNQKYATTAVTATLLRMVAEKANVPIQDIAVRNDSPCGSTIGPILSAKLGLRTVDLGSPQLSMHSIREMCCTTGIYQLFQLFKGFYEFFPEVDAQVTVD